MNHFTEYVSKRALGLLVCVVLSALGNYQAHGQDRDERGSRGEIPGQDPTFAQDPVARTPPPDDPNEPDVAKRKRFGWELGRHRLGCGLMNIESLKKAGDAIPKEHRVKLLQRWLTLVADELVPTSEDLIHWYGQWLSYRSGSKLRLVVAEWSVGDSVIRVSQLVDSERYAHVLIRSRRRASLEFRPRPTDLDGLDWQRWESVPRKQLKDLLRELTSLDDEHLDLLDENPGLLMLHGRITGCAGVQVFTGLFDWRHVLRRAAEDARNATPLPDVALPERILITKSNPQYVCIRFDLHPSD